MGRNVASSLNVKMGKDKAEKIRDQTEENKKQKRERKRSVI
jgi:hypothetical protein